MPCKPAVYLLISRQLNCSCPALLLGQFVPSLIEIYVPFISIGKSKTQAVFDTVICPGHLGCELCSLFLKRQAFSHRFRRLSPVPALFAFIGFIICFSRTALSSGSRLDLIYIQ